jgi:hypothetical protein
MPLQNLYHRPVISEAGSKSTIQIIRTASAAESKAIPANAAQTAGFTFILPFERAYGPARAAARDFR